MVAIHTLRLILGDQLNAGHSWFRKKDPGVLYVVAELHQECHYVKHHIQKICAFFSAMDAFAVALEKAGHSVLHLTLDDTQKYEGIDGLIQALSQMHSVSTFQYQRPDEFRLLKQLRNLKVGSGIDKTECDSEHFLLPFDELEDYFESDKSQTMEFFYRKMRRRFNILMDPSGKPEGGQWNYDSQNRNKLKPEDLKHIPPPRQFRNHVGKILERIEKHNIPTFGRADKNLLWPVNRRQARTFLKHFCDFCLPHFGEFQDAMTEKSEHKWSLYHSRLSFALNAKILSPLEVIDASIEAYGENKAISLAQIEGFVRQILGWREFIRGIYWLNMPAYGKKNYLVAKKKLPDWFWTGETKMNCLHNAISQSLDYAYAHHIQRLMVTGNFCLLTGVNPNEVDGWYLGIYIDAIEWVEMPNTRGMTQFADGGIVASKPYAAGGNYINKMSDYCKGCHYNVKERSGDSACPLNSLYWHFMDKHRDKFSSNRRVGMIYRNWDKQAKAEKQKTLNRASWCLNNLNQL